MAALLSFAAALLTPTAAVAVDGMRVRTPVVWSDTPCMTIVDRSSDLLVHIPYGIPFEDLGSTEDEVADGRTHQFFAFCRDHDPTDVLPGWVAEADVAAAEAAGLIDPATVTGDAILDLDPQWQACVERLTADDERRPITFTAAAEGVNWDTSSVAPGAWVVEAFTHDPAFSIWSPRPGVYKLVDDPALSASGPAAAVLNGEEVVPSGEAVTIEGCVSAMEGSILGLAWAEVGEDRWHAVVQDEPVRGEGFAIDLLLPPEMAGQAARVRVSAEDPRDRHSVAFMSELVIVLPAPPDCSDDECGTTGGNEGGSASADDTGGASAPSVGTETTGGQSAGEDAWGGGSDGGSNALSGRSSDDPVGGCACRSDEGEPRTPLASGLLIVLAGLWRRRPTR